MAKPRVTRATKTSAKTSAKPRAKAATPAKKAVAIPPRKTTAALLSVCVSPHIGFTATADGRLTAAVNGYPLDFGRLSEAAAKRVPDLRQGLKLSVLASNKPADQEIARLVAQLARQGLVEYPLTRDGQQIAVIEPQMQDYQPRMAPLGANDTLALSRFAYLRRRAGEMVLESPRAGALFQISDPAVAGMLTALAAPQKVSALRALPGFPGTELLSLLLDCQILFRVTVSGDNAQRHSEGDDSLVMWDFHDLLFHARSNEGRHANPIGGVYPYVDRITPPPAVRPRWPGARIDLAPALAAPSETVSPTARLLRARESVRDYDDHAPITLADLSLFLDGAARVLSRWESPLDLGDGRDGPLLDYTQRPYPAAGSAYELELYLAVVNCAGVARGFYHYDADAHTLTAIPSRPDQFETMLGSAEFAMDASGPPQVLVTITARFGRVAWKYSAIAYALILKDVGALLQTLYLMASDIGLGGCAVGTNNIALFEAITGVPFHVEGPVGQFAMGRAIKSEDAPAPNG